MAIPGDLLSRKLSDISKRFQSSLNKRLDKMNFKDQSGSEYEERETHPSKNVYFVQRDQSTIELWKGDIQISGQGGEWEVINALLLESSSVTPITGGANGSIFMAATGDISHELDSPSYPSKTGDFVFTTRGRQEEQNWVTRNSPQGDFNILYNYQVAAASSRQNPYISAEENSVTRYPMYVLDIIRGNTRETITLKVFQLSCHAGLAPYTLAYASSSIFQYQNTYDEVYAYGYPKNHIAFQTAIYVERTIENRATTHGYYFANGMQTTKGVKNILSVNITNIHYDSNLDKVVGTPYIFEEYSKSDSCCGQLGLRRDLVSGDALTEPLVIFNVGHPQNYENEFIMYKILKGESIT